MRLIHVLISEEQRDSILGALDDKDVDYVVFEAHDRDSKRTLVEFPLPSDGVGDVMGALQDAGLESDDYTVVGSAETATTSSMEALENRYADDFDPLSRRELRSKARDLSHDRTSFVWMISLSAIIATVGLLADSPAIVVGSMVIAPMVGPVLTAGVGTVTGDWKMLVDSIWLQAVGLAVAIGSSLVFGYVLKTFSFVPQLELSVIEQISSRVAPNLLTVVVGLAAGAASAFGLTTKGPTSLIGVMIAAALIPAAAVVGVTTIWGFPIIALGSLILLLISLVSINVSALLTLWYLGYRPDGFDSASRTIRDSMGTAAFALSILLLVLVVGATTVGTYQQITYERTINQEISGVLDESEYEDLTLVTTTVQYGFTGGLLDRETITVTVSRTSEQAYPNLADRLRERIRAETGQNPVVRVNFVDYQTTADR